MTRFQILKGELPKKIDWAPDDAFFDRLVMEKTKEMKIVFIDAEKSWKPPVHWVDPTNDILRNRLF